MGITRAREEILTNKMKLFIEKGQGQEGRRWKDYITTKRPPIQLSTLLLPNSLLSNDRLKLISETHQVPVDLSACTVQKDE